MTAPTQADAGGRSVVLAYAAVADEYAALTTGAALVDRSHRTRLRLEGAKAAEALNGLVTNDVVTLTAGHGCYAAALTAKGKIVSDVRIFADESGIDVDAPPRSGDAFVAMVRKFVNPRLAKHAERTADVAALGVFGPTAHHVVSSVTAIPAPALAALPMFGHVGVEIDGTAARVARVPDLRVEGFELFVPAAARDALWSRLVDAGARPVGLDAWEIVRVESGRPEWGIDMTDETLTQEANMEELHAVSYTKGCYVGQETVARVHFRGRVNRHLRGLRGDGDAPLARGATLHDAERAQVGEVRSAVVSPALGAIAIGMVRREIEIGARLIAHADDGERTVEVVALPFAMS